MQADLRLCCSHMTKWFSHDEAQMVVVHLLLDAGIEFDEKL